MFYYRKKIIYPKVVKKMKVYHQNILKMLKDIQPYLESNGLTYFIIDGTLLGYIRHHQKFIEYDDDIDLGIIDDDNLLQKIKNLSDDIQPLGYRIEKKFFGWAIYYINPKIKGYIDLFHFTKDKSERYVLNKESSKKWPNEWFFEDEIFPLQEDYFENILVKIPNQPIKYLERYYGKNVFKECIFTHFHQGNLFDRFVILFTNLFSKFRLNC